MKIDPVHSDELAFCKVIEQRDQHVAVEICIVPGSVEQVIYSNYQGIGVLRHRPCYIVHDLPFV